MYRKRQKVASACEFCRSKKVKCDGARPVCKTCAQHCYRVCSYDNGSATKSRNTERTVAKESSTQVDAQPIPSMSSRSEPSTYRQQHEYIDAASLKVDFRRIPAHEHAFGSQTQDGNAKDAEAMTGIVGDQPLGHEFFGSSNASLFMKQIKSIVEARWGRDQTDPQPHPPSLKSRQEPPGPAIFDTPELYFMPPRAVADAFLTCYWNELWAVFPVHDKVSFENTYSSIWSSTSVSIKNEQVFYTMLNMVFALGSQFSTLVRPDQRKEVGQIFWTRANTLFDTLISKTASVEGVQCLLLMAIFLQSSSDSYRCWMITGTAIRMAQSLGLHLSETLDRISSSETDREIARRIWHACVFIDRILSMTFGRPGMTSHHSSPPVPLPSMIDDEFFDTNQKPAAIRPDGKPTVVAFFVKAMELYGIMNDILQDLYVGNEASNKGQANLLISTLRFEDKLTTWVASLPSHLQHNTQTNEHDMYQRQRIVLRIRYLHVQMLLFRPVLANHCLKLNPHPDAQLAPLGVISQTLEDKSTEVCFEAAHEVINLFYEYVNLDNVTGPVPSWWFAVLFIYTAATVLLAERLLPKSSLLTELTQTRAQITWDRTIQLLQAYSHVTESAQRCLVAVQVLSAKISGNIPGTHEQSDRQDLNLAVDVTGSSADTSAPFDTLNYDDLMQPLDLGNLDFEIDDMFWLNSSAVQYLF